MALIFIHSMLMRLQYKSTDFMRFKIMLPFVMRARKRKPYFSRQTGMEWTEIYIYILWNVVNLRSLCYRAQPMRIIPSLSQTHPQPNSATNLSIVKSHGCRKTRDDLRTRMLVRQLAAGTPTVGRATKAIDMSSELKLSLFPAHMPLVGCYCPQLKTHF